MFTHRHAVGGGTHRRRATFDRCQVRWVFLRVVVSGVVLVVCCVVLFLSCVCDRFLFSPTGVRAVRSRWKRQLYIYIYIYICIYSSVGHVYIGIRAFRDLRLDTYLPSFFTCLPYRNLHLPQSTIVQLRSPSMPRSSIPARMFSLRFRATSTLPRRRSATRTIKSEMQRGKSFRRNPTHHPPFPR